MGTRWIRNLIPHPTSSPDLNLSKNTGRYVKNTNKKVVFYDTYPQIYIKKVFKTYMVFQIQKQFHWLTHDDMEFKLELKGPFWVEISSNGSFPVDEEIDQGNGRGNKQDNQS